MKKVDEGKLKAMRALRQGAKLSHLFLADDLLLFSEASLDQPECIKEGLDLFCKCSGQRINYHKSSLYYSLNVFAQEADILCETLGIPLKKHIGKYLGHHNLHNGNNRQADKALLQCINNRIDGWKIKCYSRVGGLTLAQSVLGSILIFSMRLE